MTRPDPKNNDAAAMTAETLLVHYSFDLSHWTAAELVDKWLENYPARWLRLAIIEALYQGRYKSISVEQILVCWQRRSRPIYHFNLEFEQLICGKLPGAKIPEQDVKLTHQSAPFDDEELAENIDPIIQETDNFLTNNPAIAPMIAISQPDISDKNVREIGSEMMDDLEEKCPAVALLSLEKQSIEPSDIYSNQSNFSPSNSVDASPSEANPGKISSVEIQRQIINDLLKDPWLDNEDEAAIQAILNSAIDTSTNSCQLETVLNLDSEPSTSDPENSEADWQETRPPIHQFTPEVESSEFYMKLKAVLEYKLQHPEEESRKRRRRGNRV